MQNTARKVAAQPSQLQRLARILKLCMYRKTCEKLPLSKRPKFGFQDQLWLNAGQKYYGSILQYFRPSLSYQLSLRPLICLFLSGCFTQVLL